MKDENENSKDALNGISTVFYSSTANPSDVLEKSQENIKKKVKYNSKQWWTLITLAFGNFCCGACVSLQAPFFPSEAERKGATPTEYGLIFGVFQLTIFITAPIMGKLVPYISPKILLNCGMLAVGIACVLFGSLDLAQDRTSFVPLAFAVRILEGVGTAAIRTSCYTIIASQFSEGIGATFASLETFFGVGLVIGPTLGGALYDLGGYGLPFYVIGSIILFNAVLIFFLLPNVEKTKMPEKGNLFRFWMHPTVLIYSLSVFTSFNYIGFNQSTLEPHIRQFGLSGVFLGMLFALSGTIYAITAPAWGWLCDKKGNSNIWSLFGCLINITSLLLIGPAPFFNIKPNLIIIITALILFGFGLGAKLVCSFTGTLQSTKDRGISLDLCTYGLISSMIASSQSLGAFVGPSIGGYLLDQFGFRNASMALLILETTVAVLLFISIFTRRSENSGNKIANQISQSVKENGLSNGSGVVLYQSENTKL